MGEFTQHNWRPLDKVVSYRTERGRLVEYTLKGRLGRCTRCGCVRDRAADYVGAPWVDERGQTISVKCSGRVQ